MDIARARSGVPGEGASAEEGATASPEASACPEAEAAQRQQARTERLERMRQAVAEMDEAAVAAGIRRKALLILDRMFDECAEISATEQRFVEEGVTNVRKLRDMTAIYKELTGGAPKEDDEDVEDLSALAELLK